MICNSWIRIIIKKRDLYKIELYVVVIYCNVSIVWRMCKILKEGVCYCYLIIWGIF